MNIEKLARESSPFTHESMFADKELMGILERFAAMVRSEVLEEAAKVADSQIERWVDDRARYCASECAASIRALKEQT